MHQAEKSNMGGATAPSIVGIQWNVKPNLHGISAKTAFSEIQVLW